MGDRVITVDKGQDFVVEVNDRSFGGKRATLLRLNNNNIDLLTTGGYLVRGVPPGSLSSEGGETGQASKSILLSCDRGDVFGDATEQWGREWVTDMSSLPTNILCKISGMVQGSCIFRVRIGGQSGQPDGAVIATMNVSAGGWPTSVSMVTGSRFVNPGGFKLLKLTGEASGVSSIRALAILLQASDS